MKLRIDGKDISTMSVDEIGATLQQIATELSIRGNDTTRSSAERGNLLFAFNMVQETGDFLRRTGRTGEKQHGRN